MELLKYWYSGKWYCQIKKKTEKTEPNVLFIKVMT